MVNRRCPGGDLGLLFRTRRRGTGAARDEHTVDLPGDIALEAADDLSFALALRDAPCYVLLRTAISTHPGQGLASIERFIELGLEQGQREGPGILSSYAASAPLAGGDLHEAVGVRG